MLKTLRDHWLNYCIEAWGLGVFMVSAGMFGTLFYSPESMISEQLLSPWRDIAMGVAMGLTAIAIIYSPWGQRSGAHINPAVTLTFFRLKKIAPWDALFYTFFQFLGGWLGVVLVAVLVGDPFTSLPVNYVVTIPGQWGWLGALGIEFFISFVLMTMVLVTSNISALSRFTGIFSGILVAFYVVFAGPISGFGMNPARTFASALPAQEWSAFWIYYFIPPVAMLIAAEFYLRLSRSRPHSICCKLCPNESTPCISPICCFECSDL